MPNVEQGVKPEYMRGKMNQGIVFAVLASLMFSIMNALVKAVTLTIPSAEVAFFRGVIGLVLIYYMMRRKKVQFSTSDIPMLILRGLLGGLYVITHFYTISQISLVDASILINLAPVIAIFLSAVFLKETLSRRAWALLGLAFIGAMLTINPFQFSAYSINALIGLLSAAIAACVAIVLRYLSTRHHTFEIIFYFMAAVTLVPIPMIWNNFVVPSYTELFYLIILGAIALVGQIFLTRAFSHDCVAVVEVVRYIGIIYNAVWGFLFWNEAPVLTTVIGGIFIIGSCIALSNPSSAKK